jgi:hypothetical protein
VKRQLGPSTLATSPSAQSNPAKHLASDVVAPPKIIAIPPRETELLGDGLQKSFFDGLSILTNNPEKAAHDFSGGRSEKEESNAA